MRQEGIPLVGLLCMVFPALNEGFEEGAFLCLTLGTVGCPDGLPEPGAGPQSWPSLSVMEKNSLGS